jgi:Tfp pilus assembly protein PilP
MTMKLTIGILTTAIAMTAAAASAQNVDAIDQARSIAKSLQQKQQIDSNAALDAAGVPASTKPAPGAPAPAIKRAVIPAANATSAGASTAKAAAPGPSNSASAHENRLERVNVVQGADNVRIEMISSESVTPRVSRLSSPDRVLVELPGTRDASPQNHIVFGSAGVKGVRIGNNGKNPPTTSVVVDLEKACTYEMSPSGSGKQVLTLHTNVVAASNPAPKAPAAAAKPATVAKSASAPVKVQPATAPRVIAKAAGGAKVMPVSKPAKTVVPVAKKEAKAPPSAKPEPAKGVIAAVAPQPEKKKEEKKEEPKAEEKKWAMTGKRDPFFSPVVQQNGSGCSTGKKCLEIGTINLRGVVKSDNGFIAVVTNNLNKAYFLRENDPVFNGYVVRITGDSVVFQETVQDKLGKSFTREVVKRIFTPAV